MAFIRSQMFVLLMTLCAVVFADMPQKLLRLPLSKPRHSSNSNSSSLGRRQDPIEVSLLYGSNYQLYEVQLPIGTPPQEVRFMLDTGSVDTWVPDQEVCGPSISCEPFDCSSSSTCHLLRSYPNFYIGYADGSDARGSYISEDIHLGDQVVRAQTIGLVETTSNPDQTGMLGLGLDSLEAMVRDYHQRPYPSLLDSMAKQGIIESKAFSLYLDGSGSENGSIVFGGYEENKFVHPIYIIPIVQQNDDSRYAVELSSISIAGFGGSQIFKSSWLPAQVVLDSGSEFSWLPSDVVDAIAGYFQATSFVFPGHTWQTFRVACSYRQQNGTLDFRFSGLTGPTITISPSELISLPSNDDRCYMTIGKAKQRGMDFVLGDSFLRSAYVTYDLQNMAIGMAQSVPNTKVPLLQSFGGNGVFGVAGAVDMSQAFPKLPLPFMEQSPTQESDSLQLTQCNGAGSFLKSLSGKVWIFVAAVTMASL